MILAVQMPSRTWKTVPVLFGDMWKKNEIQIYSQCHTGEEMSSQDLDFFRVQVLSIYLWARIHIPLSHTSHKYEKPTEDIYVYREIGSELLKKLS